MRRWKRLLGCIFVVGAVFMFIGMSGAAEAAVYASPVAVWGYPVVSPVVLPGMVPVVAVPPMFPAVPFVVGYPWVPGGYCYYPGFPVCGYVYGGAGYSLPYTADIIEK